MKEEVIYKLELNLDPDEFRRLLIDSGIKKRPLEDKKRMETMCTKSNLIYTARIGKKLVGVARSISDFAFCTYLSDLAVSENYKHRGIGKKLVHLTKQATPDALLILLAAPEAIDYYPKIGLSKFNDCYLLK